jgi:FkbH-like protein
MANDPLMWLTTPADFAGELRSALQISSPADRLTRLTALAQHRLGLLETIQLDRAIVAVPPEAAAGVSRVRLAILASSTVDHLVPAIRVAGLRRGVLFDVLVGGFGQYRQNVLDPASPLQAFTPHVVLFALTARELLAAIPLTANKDTADAAIDRHVDGLRVLWRAVRERLGAAVVQQTFLDVSEPVFGSLDRQVAAAPGRLVARLNDRLSEAAADDRALLLDVSRASERDGRTFWFDRSRWFQAKQEIAPRAAALYGDLLARLVAAHRGLSKKCLVLDLDNTLWHGVIGDDGVDGIVLGEGTAVGEAHLALQRYAKQLSSRGVILAVCSKNDPAIAEDVFRSHPEMVLKRADFAAFVANWQDKAANLEAIARELNIGIDSLVFVDDNPAERARIRQALPAVAVPELPDDVADYVTCLADAGYFESVGFTADDRQRGEQYQTNAARETLRESAASIQDYLQALEMSMECGPFAPVDLTRVTQLINKTNQFNPTTRRYTADEVARFAAAAGHVTLQFRLRDRFGDNGLVSALILVPDPAEPHVLAIDTWVMSCRVFGRQLECAAMNAAVEAARRVGAVRIRASYLPTAKNGYVRELFPSLGFASVTLGEPAPEGASTWALNVADYIPKETRIVGNERAFA